MLWRPGRTCDATICQTDVLATISDLLNTTLPDNAGEDSQSFLRALYGEELGERLPKIHHGSNGRFAVRIGDWKLVLPHKKAKIELYNLKSDPSETTNVADQQPRIVERLKQQITQVVCRGRTTEGKPQPNDTPYWDDLAWISADEYEQLTQ